MDNNKAANGEPRQETEHTRLEYSAAPSKLARLFEFSVKRGLVIEWGASGVQFRAEEGAQEGDELALRLALPGSREATLLKARVRRCRPEAWSGVETYSHVIDAEFIEVSQTASAALKRAFS